MDRNSCTNCIATIQNQPLMSGHLSILNNGQLRVHQETTVNTILPLWVEARINHAHRQTFISKSQLAHNNVNRRRIEAVLSCCYPYQRLRGLLKQYIQLLEDVRKFLENHGCFPEITATNTLIGKIQSQKCPLIRGSTTVGVHCQVHITCKHTITAFENN